MALSPPTRGGFIDMTAARLKPVDQATHGAMTPAVPAAQAVADKPNLGQLLFAWCVVGQREPPASAAATLLLPWEYPGPALCNMLFLT